MDGDNGPTRSQETMKSLCVSAGRVKGGIVCRNIIKKSTPNLRGHARLNRKALGVSDATVKETCTMHFFVLV